MHVELVTITPDAEQTMAYIARVSNPSNQDNPDYARLLRYCIQHQHWSIFEHSHMTLEIETSLAIATQILRHRSFTFQQFSARYSDPFASGLAFEPMQLRKQAEKNRQSSTDEIEEAKQRKLESVVRDALDEVEHAYRVLVGAGVARECARMILPQCTQTRLYMTGNVRSWIHYIQLRTQPDTQLEHRQIAVEAQRVFVAQLPTVAQALGWTGAE